MLLFAGQDVDVDTGLQYSRARSYSSSTGGFFSRDPIGFGGGDANLYRYVFGGPTNHTDLTGLEQWAAQQALSKVFEWSRGRTLYQEASPVANVLGDERPQIVVGTPK